MSASARMSNADAAWLHMDRPTNLMVINSILRFQARLDWERLAEVVRERLVGSYPRFRQRVVEGAAGPHWEDDPDFDLTRHMHRRGLARPGDEETLRALTGDLASMPLDRAKPLWEMYLVDGPGAGSAVIVRMHHCIADGIALARVMLSLTDSSAEGDVLGGRRRARPERAPATGLLELPAVRAATASVSLAGRAGAEALRSVTSPAHAVALAGALAADGRALAKLLFTAADAPGVLKRGAGAQRGVAWSRPLALERVKAVAHAQEATVNDVLLAAVSGVLRAYLLERGETPHEIRAMVPFNLRPLDRPVPSELGNRFGLVFLTLPVDRAGRRERLRELKGRMDGIKRSPEGPVSYAVLGAVGLTPPDVERRIVDMFSAKATAVMTNVPGPRQTVYLAGTPLRSVLVWAPTAGSIGTSVSIFSYAGEITVGLLVHTQLVPDPQSIVDRLAREVAALGRLAPASGGRT